MPEKICINGFCAAKLAPTALRLMEGLAEVAVNLYQTSYLTVPAQATGPAVKVALATVPAVVMHDKLEVMLVALPQRSFPGCANDCLHAIKASSSINSALQRFKTISIGSFIDIAGFHGTGGCVKIGRGLLNITIIYNRSVSLCRFKSTSPKKSSQHKHRLFA